jgi:hypothetical protein
VRSTSRAARRIEPKSVAERLGAEPLGLDLGTTSSPTALLALRHTLVMELRSSGGRPALEGTERRQKIPMKDADWLELERIAQSFRASGLNATAGQIAGQLLHEAIARLEGTPLPYPLPPPPPNMRVSERAIQARIPKQRTRGKK